MPVSIDVIANEAIIAAVLVGPGNASRSFPSFVSGLDGSAAGGGQGRWTSFIFAAVVGWVKVGWMNG